MSNNSIAAKPFFYTGKMTGYINVMFKKIRTSVDDRGEEKRLDVAPPLPKIKKNLKKSLDVITLVKTDTKDGDTGRDEYYKSLGKDLAALIDLDHDSENLTIIDISKWCR